MEEKQNGIALEAVNEQVENPTNLVADAHNEIEVASTPSVEPSAFISENCIDQEAESDSHLTRLHQMELKELIAYMSELVTHEISSNLRAKVEEARTVFYKKIHSLREEEKREWINTRDEPESDYVPSELSEVKEFQNLYSAFKARRREHQKHVEEEQQANLEAKRSIIARIQALTACDEVKGDTYQEFKNLVREWGAIGHVPQAEVENLYKSYQHNIQNFYDYLKINRELRDLDYKKNLDAKIQLCERAEELLVLPDPVEAFKRLQDLHAQWKEIGPVMREKNDEIWERFAAVTFRINTNHREYFEKLKEGYEANLVLKQRLCERVEEIFAAERTSHRAWYDDSNKIAEIQKEWKTIGPVPRKFNSQIWNRFQTVCEQFFATRRIVEKEVRAEGLINIQKKLDLCLQAEALKDSTDWAATARELKGLQAKWREVGATPHKRGEELWKRFRAAMDFFFEQRSKSQASLREEQQENLLKKEAIIKELVDYKVNEDVREALEWLKAIQQRWANVGFVPFKQKESIQNRYREQLDRLYDALRIDRREQNLTQFRSRVNDIVDGSAGGNVLSREKSKLSQQLRTLEAEKRQLENNMSFVQPSGASNPILDRLQSQMGKLDEEIGLVKDKVKLLDQKVREERANKAGAESKESSAESAAGDDSEAE